MSLTLASRSWSPPPQIFTQVIFALLMPGLGLTTVLLTLYGYAAWNPVSRRYLDRVMPLSALQLAHANHYLSLCFGILFTIGTLKAYTGGRCALLSSFSNLCLVFSAGMFFSIAINLPLVLAFNVNGRKMEKYYVIGMTVVGIVSNIAPYVTGNLRWDETCWYGNTNPSAMLRWLVGAQIVWILLASLGEVIAFTVIIGYLVAYRVVPEDTPTSYPSTGSHRPGSTIMRFRNIILRIGLYPLASCILNISTAVLEFCVFQNHRKTPERSQQPVYLAIYAARPLIYGLLAATDPSFIRALRALRHPQNESGTPSQIRTPGLMSTIIYQPQDEISMSEQDKEDEPGSSLEVHSDVNGTRAPIDVVSHI
ncbi:hypothetical protein C8R45DRAFT_971387 [Mycena sanguinolenta]|nr:hypothetical protein C8R45DRAFT_971387 [Mycena sanguinolenta]